jgi:hypothetical protein
MVEVGVYEGDFAVDILGQCENVGKYYMIDPWKHLADWAGSEPSWWLDQSRKPVELRLPGANKTSFHPHSNHSPSLLD